MPRSQGRGIFMCGGRAVDSVVPVLHNGSGTGIKPMLHKPLPGEDALSPWRIGVLAVACSFAIATLYYSQPILPLIGAEFGVGDAAASQIVMLGQVGYSLGLFLFVPFGDRMDRRRLILLLL